MCRTISRELKEIRKIMHTNMEEAKTKIDVLYDLYTSLPNLFCDEEVDVMFSLYECIAYSDAEKEVLDELSDYINY